MSTVLGATAVVARNSLSYLMIMCELARARRLVVSLRGSEMARSIAGIDIDRCITPASDGGWYSEAHELCFDNVPAQIVFTSGTEGPPKAVLLSFGNQANTTDRLVKAMALTREVREYIGVPVTHSFGMGRVRAVTTAGGAAYIPPKGFDFHEFLRMLARGEVNSLSVVPTLLRAMMRFSEVLRKHGKNLRWAEVGSQSMTENEKLELREVFPCARIVQHYGLTEASRTTLLDISDDDSHLNSVGKPSLGVELNLSPAGLIQIRGRHVAEWHVDSDGVRKLTNAEGWLETSDIGFIADGYLYFEGRADDQINCGGIKIPSDYLGRRILDRVGNMHSVVVVRVPDAMRGDGILVVSDADQRDIIGIRQAASAVLKDLGLFAEASLHVWSRPDLPYTATGKVRRRELASEFLQSRVNAAKSP